MTHVRQGLSTVNRHIRSSSIFTSSSKSQSQTYRFKTSTAKKLTSLDQYNKEKQAAKEIRTDLYNKKIARREGLGSRQDPEKRNYKKNQFKQWFDRMASKQAYLDRQARRQDLPWKINVAAMVERLPVVTPDKHQWELDYFYLKAELQRYDNIAYPKELGIPNPMDFTVHTQEELMGMYVLCSQIHSHIMTNWCQRGICGHGLYLIISLFTIIILTPPDICSYIHAFLFVPCQTQKCFPRDSHPLQGRRKQTSRE